MAKLMLIISRNDMTTAEKCLNMHVAVMDTRLKLANPHIFSTAKHSMGNHDNKVGQGQNRINFDGLKGDNSQSGWSIGNNDKAAPSCNIPIMPVAFPKDPWASREQFVPHCCAAKHCINNLGPPTPNSRKGPVGGGGGGELSSLQKGSEGREGDYGVGGGEEEKNRTNN